MKYLSYIFIIFTFISCQNEMNAPLGVSDTFIKFIGTDAQNEAVKALETPDGGFILLANTSENTEDPKRWIKVVMTDAGGNKIGSKTKTYHSDTEDAETQLVASNFIPYNNGYLIIGNSIKGDTSSVLLLEIDANNNEVSKKIISHTNKNSYGKALLFNENNGLFMLYMTSSITNPSQKSAVVARLNNDFEEIASYSEGSDNRTPVAELLEKPNNNLLYAVNKQISSTQTNSQFVEETLDNHSQSPFAPEIGGNSHYFLNDIKIYDDRLVAVGESSLDADFSEEVVSDRILLMLSLDDYITEDNFHTVDIGEAATGYSAIKTSDGNITILGAVGNEEDERKLVLLKVDYDGQIINNGAPFVKTYGGTGERGASILESSDGGLVLYGATNFGGLESLILIKTDRNGNL